MKRAVNAQPILFLFPIQHSIKILLEIYLIKYINQVKAKFICALFASIPQSSYSLSVLISLKLLLLVQDEIPLLLLYQMLIFGQTRDQQASAHHLFQILPELCICFTEHAIRVYITSQVQLFCHETPEHILSMLLFKIIASL